MKILNLVGGTFLLTGALTSALTIVTVTFSQPAASQRTTEIPFEICSTSKTWVRLTKAEQIKKLQSVKRFGDVTKEPALSAVETWWKHNIFSFTNYGGSAFFDYGLFSGLWSLKDPRDTRSWQCGKSRNVPAINSGEIAEVWVLQYRVINIKWVGNRYVMVVQPTKRGMQIIEFSRREHLDSLPLKAMTEDGSKVEVLSSSYGTP